MRGVKDYSSAAAKMQIPPARNPTPQFVARSVPCGLDDLVREMQAMIKAQSELAQAIRRQADAIADLAEAVNAQQDEGDEPEGLGHLGTL